MRLLSGNAQVQRFQCINRPLLSLFESRGPRYLHYFPSLEKHSRKTRVSFEIRSKAGREIKHRFRCLPADRRHRRLITWERRNISWVTGGKLNRNQSYSRVKHEDRSDCSLRKTRTTNSRETNASRVSNSQVESHYYVARSLLLLLLLNPAENTIPLIPQSVVGN